MENKTPLVSICITFFNAQKFIERILDSSLGQTYENLEVVAVDDLSSDRTAEIIKERAKKDPRIKYYRNDERLGTLRSLVKTVELAKGEFMIWPGVDDWLSRHFIEKGVNHFLRHPDIAAVASDLISLEEREGKFEYLNETIFPSGIYSSEWFIKRRYKDGKLLFGQFVLIRRKDMLHVLDYFIKTYCENPALPEEFRQFSERIFGIDVMSFIEILSRYKSFVFDETMGFIKILHPGNVAFNFKFDSVPEFLRFNYYTLLHRGPVYESKWPKFNSGMKIYSGGDTLATVFIEALRHSFNKSFIKIEESKKYFNIYFKDFSTLEKLAAVITSIWRVFSRALNFVYRKIKIQNKSKRTTKVFIPENFLNPDGKFQI